MNTEDELVDMYLHPENLANNRTSEDNDRYKMLEPLKEACLKCRMCHLGFNKARDIRDPHVFSNMQYRTRYMVVGQNPGWDELGQGEPFVGAAGKNFDSELIKNGHSRAEFYITNTVRCYTDGNVVPSADYIEKCESFLQMEMNIIKPKLVVSLGAVAFNRLCPGEIYADRLGHITKSKKYHINVYAVYHPSPMNFADLSRKLAFSHQIKVLCALMEKL